MIDTNVGGPQHAEHRQIWIPEDGEIVCDCGAFWYADAPASPSPSADEATQE